MLRRDKARHLPDAWELHGFQERAGAQVAVGGQMISQSEGEPAGGEPPSEMAIEGVGVSWREVQRLGNMKWERIVQIEF